MNGRHPFFAGFFQWLLAGAALAQSAAVQVPELLVTHVRGEVSLKDEPDGKSTGRPVPEGTPEPAPLQVAPGTQIVVGDGPGHVLVALPGELGAVMAGPRGSVHIPASQDGAAPASLAVGFNKKYSSLAFLGINRLKVTQTAGAGFRVQTPQVLINTQGGRFFIHSNLEYHRSGAGMDLTGTTVGVFDGSVQVFEPASKRLVHVKAGQALFIVPADPGLEELRPLTKQEADYDNGCKLAVYGKGVPARLPSEIQKQEKLAAGKHVNSLGMAFVRLPGTQLQMCIHETRQMDYEAFLSASPAHAAYRSKNAPTSYCWGWDDHPACATWDAARAFCEWLGKKEGRVYRLPTDEEWSMAVGIAKYEKRTPPQTPEEVERTFNKELDQGTLKITNKYPWGNEWPPPAGAGNLPDASFRKHFPSAYSFLLEKYDDGFAATAPVMSFKPNDLGLYDLAGNGFEWCEDWYNASQDTRVVRGGSSLFIYDRPDGYQSSTRYFAAPDRGSIGFRVVLEN